MFINLYTFFEPLGENTPKKMHTRLLIFISIQFLVCVLAKPVSKSKLIEMENDLKDKIKR